MLVDSKVWLKPVVAEVNKSQTNKMLLLLLEVRNARLKKFLKLQKKKNIVEEPKSNSESYTMIEIDYYHDSSTEVSEEESDSGDEENSWDTHNEEEEEDPLSLPISARDISGKLYNLSTWIDEVGSFPAKISVRARMTPYRDFRKLLIDEKLYKDFKDTCFGHLRHQNILNSMDSWFILCYCGVSIMIKNCMKYDFVLMISRHIFDRYLYS